MNTNKILSLTVSAVRSYCNSIAEDQEQAQRFFDAVMDSPERVAGIPTLEELAKIVQLCREDNAKKAGAGGQLAALKRIVKASNRDTLRGYWMDDEGRFCVVSGFHAVRLNSFVDGLPKAIEKYNSMGQIFDSTKQNAARKIEHLPTVAELKEFITIEKAKGNTRPAYELCPGLWVNPQYLIDMIGALPGVIMYAPEKPLNPIYCECEAGDGVLLPVRKNN